MSRVQPITHVSTCFTLKKGNIFVLRIIHICHLHILKIWNSFKSSLEKPRLCSFGQISQPKLVWKSTICLLLFPCSSDYSFPPGIISKCIPLTQTLMHVEDSCFYQEMVISLIEMKECKRLTKGRPTKN